jgi:hypothetical protein
VVEFAQYSNPMQTDGRSDAELNTALENEEFDDMVTPW